MDESGAMQANNTHNRRCVSSSLSSGELSISELLGHRDATAARFDALPASTVVDGVDTIVLAGGCFWGTQALMDALRGVVSTRVGYANAHDDVGQLTYDEVCTGTTGALEAVEVCYRPQVISTTMLLRWFFASIHPTQRNRQGNDFGPQYQSAVLCTSQEQLDAATQIYMQVQEGFDAPVMTQIDPLTSFVEAEKYHQKYLEHHPQGYCHVPSSLIFRARQWEEMSSLVLEESATEMPHTGALVHRNEPGIYVDYLTGDPLFSSQDRFESGCGWPSFSAPLPGKHLSEHLDKSHFMTRTEVRSISSNTHLGHVFTDGPLEKGGIRYCINSAALAFIPREMMVTFGYGDIYHRLFGGGRLKRYVVLVIGNIASGKSIAGRFLSSRGATWIDLDQIGRELVDTCAETRLALAQRFGTDILSGHRVNRALLANRAFANQEATEDLNAIMHPRIYERLVECLEALPAEEQLVVIECSAGQACTRFAQLADEVLAIVTPKELRKERARARKMSEADIEARMKIQPTDEELVAHADTIIENRGSQAEFVDQLSQWFERTISNRDISGCER